MIELSISSLDKPNEYDLVSLDSDDIQEIREFACEFISSKSFKGKYNKQQALLAAKTISDKSLAELIFDRINKMSEVDLMELVLFTVSSNTKIPKCLIHYTKLGEV